MKKLTKLDKARVIVQALFNLDEPSAPGNVHVKRIARHKAALVQDSYERARKALASRKDKT